MQPDEFSAHADSHSLELQESIVEVAKLSELLLELQEVCLYLGCLIAVIDVGGLVGTAKDKRFCPTSFT